MKTHLSIQNLRRTVQKSRGFTLMESVIAMGILGVALPLAVATMFSSGNLNQSSAQETQASLLARTVRSELRAALRGQSQIIQSKTTLSEMVESEPLILLADRNGNLLKEGTSEDFLTGVSDESISYLISISSEEVSLARSSSIQMEDMKISVEAPPRAARDKRKAVTFIERMPRVF